MFDSSSYCFDRDNRDARSELIACRSRENNGEAIEFQFANGSTHGGCKSRGIHSLALDAVLLSILYENKIDIRPIVCSPEVRFIRLNYPDNFFHNVSLP